MTLRSVAPVAIGLFLIGLQSGTASAAPPAPAKFSCPAGNELIIQRTDSMARVSYAGETYVLQRKRSSLGDKYVASDAALILDGPSAVFVAANHFDLGTCLRTIPVASE